MTITERIKLHTLGYTKDEIKEMIEAEANPAPVTEEDGQNPPQPEKIAPDEPEKPQGMSADNTQILAAIKELATAVQAANLRGTQQPKQPEQTVESIITGIVNAGEGNNNNGSK